MNDFSIYSGRLLLRCITETDTDAIFAYRSLPEVARYQYWEPFTIEQTMDFVSKCSRTGLNKDGQWTGLAIEYKGILIGDCACNISDNTIEIGCNISPEYQGMGIAKEALTLLTRYCLKYFDIKEIIGITDSRNIASIRLMESLGMKKNPDFENHIICKGEECVEYKYFMKEK